jgi:hypothetical protein
LSFCGWLISLSTISSSSIRAITYVRITFSQRLNNIPLTFLIENEPRVHFFLEILEIWNSRNHSNDQINQDIPTIGAKH